MLVGLSIINAHEPIVLVSESKISVNDHISLIIENDEAHEIK